MEVAHALVIVDRMEQDGRANVEKLDVTLVSLLTLKDLMGVSKS
jgi:orotate phosphoribosyltransferase